MKWTAADIKRTGLKQVPQKSKGYSADKLIRVARPAKYGNKKTAGFDSKKEADHYAKLKIMESCSLITALQCQVIFKLSVCSYIADFVYYDCRSRQWVVVDVKSEVTKKLPVYRMKNKMMFKELGIKIIEV